MSDEQSAKSGAKKNEAGQWIATKSGVYSHESGHSLYLAEGAPMTDAVAQGYSYSGEREAPAAQPNLSTTVDAPPEPEKRAIAGAPENKAEPGAPQNRGAARPAAPRE